MTPSKRVVVGVGLLVFLPAGRPGRLSRAANRSSSRSLTVHVRPTMVARSRPAAITWRSRPVETPNRLDAWLRDTMGTRVL